MEIGAVRNEGSSFTSKNKANKFKKKGKERTTVSFIAVELPQKPN